MGKEESNNYSSKLETENYANKWVMQLSKQRHMAYSLLLAQLINKLSNSVKTKGSSPRYKNPPFGSILTFLSQYTQPHNISRRSISTSLRQTLLSVSVTVDF
jgi:hypothetical protein